MTFLDQTCSVGLRLAAAGRDTLGMLAAARPAITLDIYEHAVILRQNTPEGSTEYAIDPKDLAAALNNQQVFSTGLIGENLLYFSQVSNRTLVIEYRKPQRTSLFIEESTDSLTVPLPGLILFRVSSKNKTHHRLFAVKRRPTTLKTRLFVAPLPNIYSDGSICWGSVQARASEESASLEADWMRLLGSPFNNHVALGKSHKYPDDIRKMLVKLEQEKARRYPTSDLIAASDHGYSSPSHSITLSDMITALEGK